MVLTALRFVAFAWHIYSRQGVPMRIDIDAFNVLQVLVEEGDRKSVV